MVRTLIVAAGLLLSVPGGAVLQGCAAAPREDGEVSRERAIEIARRHLEFAVRETEAERATEEGRPVWRVTFRGEPIGPGHPMGEVLIVLVDRRTGEVVSLAMS